MGRRWKSFRAKIVDEKSREWLFIKGLGAGIPLAIALIIASSAIGNLNLSLQSDLTKKLIDAEFIISNQNDKNDSLKMVLQKYESIRFCMQPPLSSRILKPGLFLYYNGYHNKYSVSTFTDTLIAEKFVPKIRPDTFSFNDTTYMIFTEAIIDIQGIVGDTACFYFDIYNK